MSLSAEALEKITSLVHSDRVVLFMKGTPEAPQCGFSATVVQLLSAFPVSYTSFDVLQDSEIRAGIKEYASWPTVPQLYVDGEFVGGCDIVESLYASGELERRLCGSPPDVA